MDSTLVGRIWPPQCELSVNVGAGIEREGVEVFAKDSINGQVVSFPVEQGPSAGGFEAFGVIELGETKDTGSVFGDREHSFGPEGLYEICNERTEGRGAIEELFLDSPFVGLEGLLETIV